MTSMRDKYVNLLTRQIGYPENPLGSNKTKYGRWFDVEAWQYFNGKKNGACGWCAELVIWGVAQDEILGKAESMKFLGLPAPKNNAAAGCPQFYNYLVAKGYKIDKTKGIKGDIIFFNTSLGKCSHVGSIKREDNNYYYTIEGNKSNRVGEGKYAKNSSSIYAVCHLPWEKYDTVEAKPIESLPTTTTPVETPTINYYRVKTLTGATLTLRSAPNKSSSVVANMPQNSTIVVKNFVTGQLVYGSKKWAYVTYKGKSGYCTATRIKKM